MFFGNEIVSKKEPIRVLWLAATLGRRSKKLSKKKILDAHIPSLTSEIIEKGNRLIVSSLSISGQPPLHDGFVDYSSYSLRLSSTLLLGVVVIFNKKAQYLLSEGNQMVHKARQISVRLDQTSDSTLLDKKSVARFETITLKPFKDFELIADTSMLSLNDELMSRWYQIVGANSNGECEELSHLQSSSTVTIEAELNGSKPLENELQGDISMIKPVRESEIFMAGVDIFESGMDPIQQQDDHGDHELGGLEVTSIIDQPQMMIINDNELDTTFTNPKKRKRNSVGKLIFDDQTQIPSDTMRTMIQDYSSLIDTKRGYAKTSPFSKVDNLFSVDIFSKERLDKQTIDRLFVSIPCGYDPTNYQFNSDFDNIFMRGLKKQKSEKDTTPDNNFVNPPKPQMMGLVEEDIEHLNNFLDGELGGLDGGIEQPREEHFEFPERLTDEDELTSILLNPEDISVILSPSGPTFQKQISPKKRPSLIEEDTDELLKVFENDTTVPTNSGSTMLSKSWGMLTYMKKKVEEESLRLNNGEKIYLSFDKLIREGNNTKRLREKASQGFYQLLVLASNNHIDIKSLDKIYVKQ